MSNKNDYIKHAQGIIRYYQSMIRGNSGHPKWQETGLAAAERYLSLVESERTSIKDMEEFLSYLKDKTNRNLYGGSAWEDITNGIRHWLRFKRENIWRRTIKLLARRLGIGNTL